jgi:hypothetical protein
MGGPLRQACNDGAMIRGASSQLRLLPLVDLCLADLPLPAFCRCQVPALGKHLWGRLYNELTDDVSPGGEEERRERVQLAQRGVVQAQHEPRAIMARVMGSLGSTLLFSRGRLPTGGKIRHSHPLHRMAQPCRDVTPCGRRRLLHPLPPLRLKPQGGTLGSAWWPAVVCIWSKNGPSSVGCAWATWWSSRAPSGSPGTGSQAEKVMPQKRQRKRRPVVTARSPKLSGSRSASRPQLPPVLSPGLRQRSIKAQGVAVGVVGQPAAHDDTMEPITRAAIIKATDALMPFSPSRLCSWLLLHSPQHEEPIGLHLSSLALFMVW